MFHNTEDEMAHRENARGCLHRKVPHSKTRRAYPNHHIFTQIFNDCGQIHVILQMLDAVYDTYGEKYGGM